MVARLRLVPGRRNWLPYAMAAAWVVLGVAIGVGASGLLRDRAAESASLPTATTLPSAIATASAVGWAGFTVTIGPPRMMRSAGAAATIRG